MEVSFEVLVNGVDVDEFEDMFMELLLNVSIVSDDCLFNSIEFWLFVSSSLVAWSNRGRTNTSSGSRTT